MTWNVQISIIKMNLFSFTTFLSSGEKKEKEKYRFH